MSDRIIIGESDRAGLAISAPLETKPHRNKIGDIRWVQREESFSLQQYREWEDRSNPYHPHPIRDWVDVCVSKEGI